LLLFVVSPGLLFGGLLLSDTSVLPHRCCSFDFTHAGHRPQ
jgi:hypothetical protein